MTHTTVQSMEIAQRVAKLNWKSVVADLDNVGIAAIGPLLGRGECHDLSAVYNQIARFRSTIDMAHHRFGEGQYRYFAHPLPRVVAELRASFWPHLVPIARDWAARLKRPAPWPDDFDAW